MTKSICCQQFQHSRAQFIYYLLFSQSSLDSKSCVTNAEISQSKPVPRTLPKDFYGGFHGQKDPVLLCYCFQYFKGHSGRQTTPIDPCQRTFKGFSRTNLSSFQSNSDPFQGSKPAQVCSVSKTRPESTG